MYEVYTVKNKDTLWDIAEAYYGDGSLWERIFAANQTAIASDPNTILEPGLEITVPLEEQTAAISQGSDAGERYTLQEDDTLWDIAEAHYGDGSLWEQIFAANREALSNDPENIIPGQQLVIPLLEESSSMPDASGNQLYTVEGDESLWDIAEKFYGDGSLWELIYEMNEDLIGDDPEDIEPGDEIVIPAAGL